MKIKLIYDADDILRLCQDDAKKRYPEMHCRPWINSVDSPEVEVEVTE